MPDVVKRLRYFDGQFLQDKDFTDEQEYHVDRQRRHNKYFHTSGIVHDLSVGVNGSTATVNPGTAVDGEGQMIVLDSSRPINLVDRPNQTLLLVISYDETTSDEAQVGKKEDTRIHENPRVEALPEAEAPPAGTHIRLARLVTGAGGAIQNKDDTVRVQAGVQIGDEMEVRRLRFGRDVGAEPELTSNAAGQVNLTGSLQTTGNITTNGTLSGTLATNIVNANALADNTVSIRKLNVRRVANGTTNIAAGGSSAPVVVATASVAQGPTLPLFLVRAFSKDKNANLSWSQRSITSADGAQVQQVIVFRSEGVAIQVEYEIFELVAG